MNKVAAEQVAGVYGWIDEQIRVNTDPEHSCCACGRCCDFESYDHRLFLTTPELKFFVKNVGKENVRQMKSGRCPYNIENKCSVYSNRFAGCRIFNCKGDSLFQNSLTESAIKKFQQICEEFNIAYNYTDLSTALNSAGDQYLSIG